MVKVNWSYSVPPSHQYSELMVKDRQKPGLSPRLPLPLNQTANLCERNFCFRYCGEVCVALDFCKVFLDCSQDHIAKLLLVND